MIKTFNEWVANKFPGWKTKIILGLGVGLEFCAVFDPALVSWAPAWIKHTVALAIFVGGFYTNYIKKYQVS
jgi:hypothetical protein